MASDIPPDLFSGLYAGWVTRPARGHGRGSSLTEDGHPAVGSRSQGSLTRGGRRPNLIRMSGGSVLRILERQRLAATAAVVLAVGALTACGSKAPEPTSSQAAMHFTRGPVPDSARLRDGSIDLSQVPDFIPAAGDDRNVGWIWSADVFPRPGEAPVEVVTVYADDLITVVGRMFPEVGFVPIGAENEMLPDPHQDRELTIRVRNESERSATLEITDARDESDGPPRLISPPIVVAAGSDEDIVFRAPRDRWSLNLRGDLGFFFSDDLGRRADDPDFSLVVGADRVLRIAGGE